MPGSSSFFQSDLERPISFPHSHSLRTLLNLPLPFSLLLPNLNPHKPTPLTPQKTPTPKNPFAERFKYDIISSSLLSSSLLPFTSHSHPLYSPSGSRNRSRPSTPARGRGLSVNGSLGARTPPETETEEDYRLLSITCALSVVLLSAGYYIPAIICLAFVFYYLRAAAVAVVGNEGVDVSGKDIGKGKADVMAPTLEALHELIAAGDVWDSVVHEAMSIVENEERSTHPHPSPFTPFTPSAPLPPPTPNPNPHSPSKSPTKSNPPQTPLRISLHTTLHTTHTQSDNVRALFSALTLPEEISQLAEMYAPPSPVYARGRGAGAGVGVGMGGLWGGGGMGSRRPVSLPQTGSIRPLSLSIPTSPYKPYNYNYDPDHDDEEYDNEGRRLGAGAGVGVGVGKRATWNGSYSALAMAGSSPSGQMLRRREKRRSDLVGLFGGVGGTPTRVGSVKGKGKMRETTTMERDMLGQGQGKEEEEGEVKKGGLRASRGSVSAPVTPVLLGVEEEGGVESKRDGEAEAGDEDGGEAEVHFGMDALKLHKKRRQDGLSVFGLSPPSSSSSGRPYPNPYSSTPSTPHRPFLSSALTQTPTFSPGSRFTTLQPTSRHPLSINALHHALQNALASKRYACSYLLALRFDGDGGDGHGDGDGDEEAYWEDVRSVMGLLTSMFADAAARLTEALEDAEDTKHREREAEAEASDEGVEDDRRRSVSPSPRARAGGKDSVRTMAQMMMMVPSADGFAPMPSQLARFGAHVDAISSAMNEARENLERCVASLREEEELPAFSSRGVVSVSSSSMEDPALLAYERLRRELGLALRECERGRERLLDLIAASNPSPEPPEEEDLPGLGHDVGSDESDKHDSSSPLLDFGLGGDELGAGGGAGVTVVSHDNVGEGLQDDATTHLLRMASSHHLPPQGIEQVFEAEPEPLVPLFTRERSKLTREERIALSKKRRDSGLGLSSDERPVGKVGMETWGPGGDVVQELKDVIWQVGERRRKMTDGGGDS
ncbi:hypothetical protein PILCRDRAFT_176395 [Piloderma croceum F 1598]|uniref:Uncharacterized protein n=1 Tax=Piloderma croceum (strain F 1598) TaxID=765440 RepID=A0A0C3BUN9_PILCF|nr:hypothetical protein PILCRDRAFT_176395 [Piloderma croceum F 1598]